MSGVSHEVPVAIDPVPGEAWDSYLERLAAANDLTTRDLERRIRLTSVTPTRLRHLAAVPEQINADALNAVRRPPDPRDAPDGWAPGAIVQACPRCLAQTGAWLQRWYDPLVTCCLKHSCYLISTCPGCDRPLRDYQHTPLRPVTEPTMCGNARGAGRDRRCDTDLATIVAEPAPATSLGQQERLAQSPTALTVLSDPRDPDQYRDTVRHLAALLLHIGDASSRAPSSPGARHRWHLAPPRGPHHRASVFDHAHQILTTDDLDDAVTHFQPWFDAIPPSWEGRAAWAADHTTPTPALRRLIFTASTPRRRLSHRLPRQPQLAVPLEHLPQVIPEKHAALLTGCGLTAVTARRFASLCLAKAGGDVSHTWSDAARRLDLPDHEGVDLARLASAQLTASPQAWIDHLTRLAEVMRDEAIDYQLRGRQLQLLEANPLVLTAALRAVRPGTKDTSSAYVLTWYAEEWAGRAPRATNRRERALYRQFTSSLRRDHKSTMERAAQHMAACPRGSPTSREHR